MKTLPEFILKLLFDGVINIKDAKNYYKNWLFFENNRLKIETRYDGKWVISLNGKLFADRNLQKVEKKIAKMPNANRAYMELVGRITILNGGRVSDKGRMIIKVKLKGKNGYEVEKELAADTGAPITVIDSDNFTDLVNKGGAKGGKAQGTNFGPMIEILDATMEVEVRNGKKETKSCSKMWASSKNKADSEKLFDGARGLLGMDQFDELGADPTKTPDKKKAYLRKRVDPDKEKEDK